MPTQPCKKPVILRNILSDHELKMMQKFCLDLYKNGRIEHDTEDYHRKFVHNHQAFQIYHHKKFQKIASGYFEEPLKPSYCFTSMYDKSEGFCPYHTDRAQCYRTVDLCINQNEAWPIYVASKETDIKYDYSYYMSKQEYYRSLGEQYLLEPGDALLYSGTQFPHWREKIQHDNFCHLAFFHFVPKDFQDGLD
jgi:hypothetical protein